MGNSSVCYSNSSLNIILLAILKNSAWDTDSALSTINFDLHMIFSGI